MSELAPEATPDGGEPATDAAEAPAEDWSFSQEDYQQMQQTLQEQREAIEYFASSMQPQFPPQQQGPEPIELDPLSDDFQSRLDQWADQKFAGYAEYVHAQQVREGHARAKDIIADDVAKNGDFIYAESAGQVGSLVGSYIDEANQQYPNDPRRAAEAAYERAIADVRTWEVAVGKAYHERQLNQLSTLSGAPRELAAAGANGAQQGFTVPPGGNLIDVARRHGQMQGT